MATSAAKWLPGGVERRLPADRGEVAVTILGTGSPVLLLHGYPQTRAMWHAVAPRLAAEYTVVAADLPGYGDRFDRCRRPATTLTANVVLPKI